MNSSLVILLGIVLATNKPIAEVQDNNGFDWSKIITMPSKPPENTILSPQVLHFYPYGKSVTNHESTQKYIDENMGRAKVFESDADHMHFAVKSMKIEGLVLEFGVCTGRSINFMAALLPRKIVHGFDSFKGLPEDWKERGISKDTFGFSDETFRPPVLNNVRLHVGLFHEVLPSFVESIGVKPAALIHLDADLYQSTKTVFQFLKNSIVPGTILNLS